MNYEHIISQDQLRKYCGRIADAPWVAFDTEFVSEETYLPELCLIQVATADTLAVIDPLTIGDLKPFWQLFTREGIETIVHAGREEYRFCRRAVGESPKGWLDIQIAAGLIGLEYPAAYGTLVSKLLGTTVSKDETRTDWRRRPLTSRQLEYALQDVIHLHPIRTRLIEELDQRGRRDWLATEIAAWCQDLESVDSEERWQRIPGISGLSRRALAAVRSLWRWREDEAGRRNRPAKRILRDDLLVELARRQSADDKRIRAVRGMNYRGIERQIPDIAAAIQEALAIPEDECPSRPKSHSNRSELSLLAQFLATALGSICREAEVATSLVGTSQDVRDLIAHHLRLSSFPAGKVPSLAEGWRKEIVGDVIQRLLDGDLIIRISQPLSDQPLSIERPSPC